MSERRSIAQLRANLSELVRKAERGEEIEITRRGEPVAVLLGRNGYESLRAARRGFRAAYDAFAREVGLADLEIDPDEVFGDVRDLSAGRRVAL